MTKDEFNQFIEDKLQNHPSYDYDYIAERIETWEKTKLRNNPHIEDMVYLHAALLMRNNNRLSVDNALEQTKEDLKTPRVNTNKKYFYKWLELHVPDYKSIESKSERYYALLDSLPIEDEHLTDEQEKYLNKE